MGKEGGEGGRGGWVRREGREERRWNSGKEKREGVGRKRTKLGGREDRMDSE